MGAEASGTRPASTPLAEAHIPLALVERLSDLCGVAVKVLLYIIHYTDGGRHVIARSLLQLTAGAVGADGQPLDPGTGLSRPALLGAITALEG